MGWSHSAAAGRTLDAIEHACKASRPAGEASSNVFHANGRRYFYEVDRKDQPDSGIRGHICLCLTDDTCRPVGRFVIDGRGNVIKGPALFRRALVGPRPAAGGA